MLFNSMAYYHCEDGSCPPRESEEGTRWEAEGYQGRFSYDGRVDIKSGHVVWDIHGRLYYSLVGLDKIRFGDRGIPGKSHRGQPGCRRPSCRGEFTLSPTTIQGIVPDEAANAVAAGKKLNKSEGWSS